ncbi:MAG: hypothetical protein KAR40_11010 [Candidatus Sabulitectum sp.]|nr:hypothetical protein [Candidatus Sabulitectum sp.]
MTIKHHKTDHLRRTKYECNICGNVDFWSSNWSRYTSIDHDDTCPDEMPDACSEECRVKMMEKIESGEFVLPKLSRGDPGGCKVKKPREGY